MLKVNVLQLGNLKWIDAVDLDNDKKLEILKNYNFHELDIEATLEENQFPRVNAYDNYIFIILHFPKYIQSRWYYVINEFNIFLGKDFLITFRDYNSSHVNKIFEQYKSKEIKEEEKINPGYILYEIIQVMLEKMFKVIYNLKKDLRFLEEKIFEDASADEVKIILIKKRNIVFLKHIFQPQVVLLRQLENSLNKFFQWEYELYFEDLEDKIDFVINQVSLLYERIETIEDAFRNMVDIKLNKTMALLTVFSALMLPLTLITSFYGMNVPLPYQNESWFVYSLLIGCTILMLIALYFMKKKKII
jgi:magnesium transporter